MTAQRIRELFSISLIYIIRLNNELMYCFNMFNSWWLFEIIHILIEENNLSEVLQYYDC